jgi:hypothetical protein
VDEPRLVERVDLLLAILDDALDAPDEDGETTPPEEPTGLPPSTAAA